LRKHPKNLLFLNWQLPASSITKNEIATTIAGKLEILQTDAQRIIQMLFDCIADTIVREGRKKGGHFQARQGDGWTGAWSLMTGYGGSL
jgi:hypothetical protein